MKILLSQNEIEQAVREFVGKGVSLANGAEMTVEFSMGRGDNGLTAAIDVPYMGVSSLPVTAVGINPPTTPAPVRGVMPPISVQATDPKYADPVMAHTAPRVNAPTTQQNAVIQTTDAPVAADGLTTDEPEQGTAPAETEGTTTVDATAATNGRSLFQNPTPK